MILCSMPVWDVLATNDAGCLMPAWPIFLILFARPYPCGKLLSERDYFCICGYL